MINNERLYLNIRFNEYIFFFLLRYFNINQHIVDGIHFDFILWAFLGGILILCIDKMLMRGKYHRLTDCFSKIYYFLLKTSFLESHPEIMYFNSVLDVNLNWRVEIQATPQEVWSNKCCQVLVFSSLFFVIFQK